MQDLLTALDQLKLLFQSPVFHALLAYWLISVVIGYLPMPKPGGSPLYRKVFHVANIAAANVKRVAVALKVPLTVDVDFDARTQL